MTNTKREKFLLWIDQYEEFKRIANEKGISASELLREAVYSFEDPDDHPKKMRNLTIDAETSKKIQEIADKWFSNSGETYSGNRSDAVQFLINKQIKMMQ